MTAVTTNMPKRVSFGNTYTSLVETLVEDDDTSTDERRFYRETFMTSSTTTPSQEDADDDSNREDKSLLDGCPETSQNSSQITCNLEETPVSEKPSDLQERTQLPEGQGEEEGPKEGAPATPPSDLQGPSIPSQPLRITPIIRLQRSPSTESHENPFTADGELSKKAEYIIRHSTISRSEIRISDPDLTKAKPVEEVVQRTAVPTSNAAPPSKDRENGKVEVSPKDVEVEVAAANASQPQPQQAEQVKVKGSKCKCCVVM